ncbi:Lrp/AsnC family transcriptional regulator [Diaphorobacter caeni]|uniref:Lrp/AsnC family transcriptional regulator n=1 Tax=Diaphorobacter caeni TaxID=2784387 RepID=UPI00188EBC6C|nr:Lrp/AsnC family transcriptional regulator [Diaphorobacter caeni]MBF5006933.1 Lrp/AsnC family transcriptional regulator [Diaphorobacter caeni]
MLTADDALLIEHLHGNFPLVDRPFGAVANELGWSEEQVLKRLGLLLTQGVLTRFGPLFQIERAGGQFLLAAMAVPEERFDDIALTVNSFTEIAHNYRRDHALNMWFVIGAESPELANAVAARIEAETGIAVAVFPKEEEFFVELRLQPLTEETRHGA